MPERSSFPDDRHRDERIAEIKRQCEERLQQEQKFLTSLTAQQLQTLFRQMFVGTPEDRVHAVLKWAGVCRKKHLLLPESSPSGRIRRFLSNAQRVH